MQKHVQVVAALRIGFGVLGVLGACIVLVALIGPGIIASRQGDPDALTILTIIAVVVAAVILVLSIPGIIAGYGLLRFQNWARILTMVLAVLDLFNIPIGTAVGIYSLWVLTQHETEQLFTAEVAIEG
jgi:O-antigen/teichoic acid export membrane protein